MNETPLAPVGAFSVADRRVAGRFVAVRRPMARTVADPWSRARSLADRRPTLRSFAARLLTAAAFVGLAASAPAALHAQAGASSGAGYDALAVLNAASARYESARALCADFRQHLSVPLLDQEREGSGRLCQARPNLFSMRFSDPAGDAIVVDGEHVWVYYPSQDERQVMRAPVGFVGQGSGLDFHREFLHDPASKYAVRADGTEQVEGRTAHRIRLVPKGEARYREAVVWVDARDRLVRRIRIYDENGSVRTIHLSDISLDPAIAEGTFRFSPPANVQVIDRSGR